MYRVIKTLDEVTIFRMNNTYVILSKKIKQ